MIIGPYARKSVPLTAIKSFASTSDGKVQVTYLDGDTDVFGENDVDAALKNTMQVTMPADGAQVLETIWSAEFKKPEDVGARAILGFGVDGRGQTVAITLDGIVDEPVILFADGHVEAFEQRWSTLEEYRRHLIDTAVGPGLVGADA